MPKAPTAPRTYQRARRGPRSSAAPEPQPPPWLYKSQAMAKYHLTEAEVDAVPVLVTETDPYNGQPVAKYAEAAVVRQCWALGRAMGIRQTDNRFVSWLAEKKGAKIMRTKAIEKYKVKAWQLDRIKPMDEQTNRRNG
ncbi:hypothetical protein MIND_01080600 [Mycena indigotica]|uniref:Uncharacterized protein n=1 Tax=Mycena indigotica TaxID=2126181 RepID=A0A8H6SAX7_9AGAR|nr:uncharacterized protein MIND_01080600 [Mycena indigotica]KAF7295410.1 hypothetical protein MIND_01080600 [Mycena indigotica]